MEKNTAYAYLSVDEFSCSVDEPTSRIGLQPTQAWQVGDLVPPIRFPRKHSAWKLKSRLPRSEEVERHVADVLEQIRGRENLFHEIANEYSVRMQCVGYYNEYNPGFNLELEIVRCLAQCGMKIDLDAYYLYSEKNETEVKPD